MFVKPLPGIMDDPFHPLSQGCVCHLLLNEGSGSFTYDASGYGNHGTLSWMDPNSQNSGWGGSSFGTILQFDGSNDVVTCPSKKSINFGSSDSVSVEAWMYVKAFPPGGAPNHGVTRILAKSEDTSHGYSFWFTTALMGAYAYGRPDNYANKTTTINTGRWHHFIFSDEKGTVTFYHNGINLGTDYKSSGYVNTSADLIIGRNATDIQYLNGKLGMLRIYNRGLNEKEAKLLYYDPFCNSLKAPAWQSYVPVGVGLSIPVAMHQYRRLRV